MKNKSVFNAITDETKEALSEMLHQDLKKTQLYRLCRQEQAFEELGKFLESEFSFLKNLFIRLVEENENQSHLSYK